MYNGELGYRYGFAAFSAALISGIVMILVGRTGFIINRLRALNLVTVPEYFEVKYSSRLRILTGFLVAIGGILNMGIFLRVEGEFLTVISGLNPRYILWTMAAILLIEVTYTALGGMVSVVITDYMQYLLLSLATLLVSWRAIHLAGWHHMAVKVASVMGDGGFNPLAAPHLGWQFLLWQSLLWVAINTCWQTTAMRIFSTKDAKVSRRIMTWTGCIFLGRGMLPMAWGIVALTLFGTGTLINGVPAPIVNHQVLAPIDAMPAMLRVILQPGIRGIVVAGMLAATMSVNSSYLLGWSAVISQDIIAPLRRSRRREPLSDRSQVRINRLVNVGISFFLLFWGLYYHPPDAVYLYLNVTGTIFLAGAFVSVAAGLYWPRATTTGAYLAMLLGAAGAIVPFFFLHWGESVTGFVAFAGAAFGMLAGSYATRPSSPGRPQLEPRSGV